MKLISLNIWAGREFDELIKFLRSNADDTDVFCFQEVFDNSAQRKWINEFYRADIFSMIKKELPDHEGYFAPAQDFCDFEGSIDYEISWGIAMFIKKSLKIKKTGDFFIKGHRNSKGEDNKTIPRNLQYVVLTVDGREYTIAHFHGLWNGTGKTDTDERIEQSKKVKSFTDNVENKLILCGDFNLLPDTQSLLLLEEKLINLIKKYGIKTTRSKLYERPGKFADYVLVSQDIKIEKFEVPDVCASDHLPMILQFE